jgi:hypothetical protein
VYCSFFWTNSLIIQVQCLSASYIHAQTDISETRAEDLLYHFIQFVCHASHQSKYTKIFVHVTGHRRDVRISKTSHKIGGKCSKKQNFRAHTAYGFPLWTKIKWFRWAGIRFLPVVAAVFVSDHDEITMIIVIIVALPQYNLCWSYRNQSLSSCKTSPC